MRVVDDAERHQLLRKPLFGWSCVLPRSNRKQISSVELSTPRSVSWPSVDCLPKQRTKITQSTSGMHCQTRYIGLSSYSRMHNCNHRRSTRSSSNNSRRSRRSCNHSRSHSNRICSFPTTTAYPIGTLAASEPHSNLTTHCFGRGIGNRRTSQPLLRPCSE